MDKGKMKITYTGGSYVLIEVRKNCVCGLKNCVCKVQYIAVPAYMNSCKPWSNWRGMV
jgi:hypothetical protein